MDIQPLTLSGLLIHMIGDMANALGDRPGATPEQCAARIQAATQAIMAFQTRDPIEAMCAGHCVMFHEMVVDRVRATMRGEGEAAHHRARGSIVAMDKAFGVNLARLERYRKGLTEASPDARPTIAGTETDIASRVHRHQTRPPEPRERNAWAQSPNPESMIKARPMPETMAATEVARFTRTLTEGQLRKSQLATSMLGTSQLAKCPSGEAAAAMSGSYGFTPETPPHTPPAAHAGNRQARRHPNR